VGPSVVSSQITVIEDDDGLRRALVRLLEASGHEVSSFPSAEALLASDERRHVACLILDIRLPGLSGFELRQRLAGEGYATPAIYVTAHDDPAARARANEECAAFLLKPVDGRALLGAIAEALERGA
jgi:FixJ family two-component response regulator